MTEDARIKERLQRHHNNGNLCIFDLLDANQGKGDMRRDTTPDVCLFLVISLHRSQSLVITALLLLKYI